MTTLDIYPAIDLMDGKVVRLYKGKKDSAKVYGDPLEIAQEFSEQVNKIHIVDLDGAFEGEPQNFGVVERIIEETGLSVQLGGGLRKIETLKRAYNSGVENGIIGTMAFDEEFLEEASSRFPGLTVSLDVKGGKVRIKGWEEKSALGLDEAFEYARNYVDRFVFTSVESDGTLVGISKIDRFWEEEKVIYAGGVTSLVDIKNLEGIGFSAAIIGKALYEGNIKLSEALAAVE